MSEIIVHIVTLSVFHKQMLIPFRHRMDLGDMSNDKESV